MDYTGQQTLALGYLGNSCFVIDELQSIFTEKTPQEFKKHNAFEK